MIAPAGFFLRKSLKSQGRAAHRNFPDILEFSPRASLEGGTEASKLGSSVVYGKGDPGGGGCWFF